MHNARLSPIKARMAQFCLFEEYIYNLFMHFARVCEDGGRFEFPVLFQKKRLSLNDQIDIEMVLMENYYTKFKMLGKGRVFKYPEDDSTLKDKDKVEQIWASKMEFILAIKEFYKKDVLPLKREILPPRIEQLVSKKLCEYAQLSKYKVKAKDPNELSVEPKKSPDLLIEKKSIKLKSFVERTFMTCSPEKTKPKLESVISHETRKLMNIRRLIGMHKSNALKMRRFCLKDPNQTQQLLQNLSINLKSLARIGEMSDFDRLSRTDRPSLLRQKLNQEDKRAIVDSYLRKKFVSNHKLF